MISYRSLRVRLSILYVVLTMGWMSAVGLFSYLYLRQALTTSRAATMVRREQRLINYVNDAHAHLPGMGMKEEIYHFLEASSTPNDLIQIFDLSGHLIYPEGTASPSVVWPGHNCFTPCFGEISIDRLRMRTINHITILDGHPVRLCMAGWMDEQYDMLNHVIRSYLLVAPLMLLASIAGGMMLSRRAMKPVDRITRDARIIGIHDLKRRLPVPDTRDELQRLTETWNELLERLDSAVGRLKQFTGDISHDLRTSTTVMLATAEVALRMERSPQGYQTALQTIAQECQSTSRMLDDLLALTTADFSQSDIARLPVNLAEVLDEVCEQMQAHAAVKEQQLTCDASRECWIAGDLQMLRRLISILLDNAIKYTPRNGAISASVTTEDWMIRLDVSDTGIGIAPEITSHIFDRFFRADPARGRDGRGLGLAIAKWIAESHGSMIYVSTTPGHGSTFTVKFPCYQPGEKNILVDAPLDSSGEKSPLLT